MSKPWLYSKLKEINELSTQSALVDKNKIKQEVKILVVDDNDVPFLDILQNNDYQIKHHEDITDLSVVNNYDIILCDIQGVGKSLNPTSQGAHLVKEIKKLFPFKQVIAFTANPADPGLLNTLQKADNILKKDASEDDWIEALDECIQKFGNPIKQWKNIRQVLLDNNVSTKGVAHLESNFVKAIQRKNKNVFLESQKDYPNISPEIWDILKGLASLIKVFIA